MICVAEFVSALIAFAAIVTVIAVIVIAAVYRSGELTVNLAVILLAAVVTTAIKAVTDSFITVVAAAAITPTFVKRSSQFKLDQPYQSTEILII
jgi:hypothetical protein